MIYCQILLFLIWNYTLFFFCLAPLQRPLSMYISSMELRRDCTVACLLTTSAVCHRKPLPSPHTSLWSKSCTWTRAGILISTPGTTLYTACGSVRGALLTMFTYGSGEHHSTQITGSYLLMSHWPHWTIELNHSDCILSCVSKTNDTQHIFLLVHTVSQYVKAIINHEHDWKGLVIVLSTQS